MGLLNELNTINRTLENNQRELTKTQQKEQQKERKKTIYKLLFQQFSNCFEEVTSENELNLLIKELLKNKGKNIVILSEYLDKPAKNDIDYIEKIYISTMNEAKKDIEILLNIEQKEERSKKQLEKELEILKKEIEREKEKKYKLLERERKEEARQEEIKQRAQSKEWIQKQKEKQIAFNNIIITLKTITLILASPFILIMFFVWGICKNTK